MSEPGSFWSVPFKHFEHMTLSELYTERAYWMNRISDGRLPAGAVALAFECVKACNERIARWRGDAQFGIGA